MQIGIVGAPWGLTVDECVNAAKDAERLGFPAFYLGDHFFVGKQQDSIDPYLLCALIARETSAIRFGPLVTPVTFRAPWELGRWGAQLDILSGGRFVMGLGVGWSEPEHVAFGVPYPPLKERFDRLDEAIQVMRLMWQAGPATFDGHYYRLAGADSLPKPATGRPPIVIGGVGERRTLRLVAQYAAEWNANILPISEYRRKRDVLDRHCEAAGRDPATIRHSMLGMGPIGGTQAELDHATRQLMELLPPASPVALEEYRQAWKARGAIVGRGEEIIDQLGRLSEAGVDEVIFVDSPGVMDFLAADVLPRMP